jgi:hypothetical protein
LYDKVHAGRTPLLNAPENIGTYREVSEPD